MGASKSNTAAWGMKLRVKVQNAITTRYSSIGRTTLKNPTNINSARQMGTYPMGNTLRRNLTRLRPTTTRTTQLPTTTDPAQGENGALGSKSLQQDSQISSELSSITLAISAPLFKSKAARRRSPSRPTTQSSRKAFNSESKVKDPAKRSRMAQEPLQALVILMPMVTTKSASTRSTPMLEKLSKSRLTTSRLNQQDSACTIHSQSWDESTVDTKSFLR